MSGIVQTAFKHIYKTGVIMGGCLTKIIMFDKGLTYLVVFGLPGYLHDNQSAHALKFSYKVSPFIPYSDPSNAKWRPAVGHLHMYYIDQVPPQLHQLRF